VNAQNLDHGYVQRLLNRDLEPQALRADRRVVAAIAPPVIVDVIVSITDIRMPSPESLCLLIEGTWIRRIAFVPMGWTTGRQLRTVDPLLLTITYVPALHERHAWAVRRSSSYRLSVCRGVRRSSSFRLSGCRGGLIMPISHFRHKNEPILKPSRNEESLA